MMEGPFHVLKDRYLKSFATPDMRVKINTTSSLITSIAQFIAAFLASFLLECVDITYAYIYTGTLSVAISIIIIKYMKPRFRIKS